MVKPGPERHAVRAAHAARYEPLGATMASASTPAAVLLASAMLMTALAGCAGWPSSADESSLPDSQVGGYCTRTISDTAEIAAAAGVTIEVRPLKDKLDQTLLLDVRLVIPAGVTVRFRLPAMRLRSAQWREDQLLAIHHFSGLDGTEHAADSVLASATRGPPGVFTPWYFAGTPTARPATGIRQVQEFTFWLPVMEINGRDFQPEPVTFRSYRTLGPAACR